MPSNKEIKRWFANPNNGIDTLGSDCIRWIDLDVKQFESQLDCDRAFNLLLERQPQLKETLLEKTHSGGYRIGVKVKQAVEFTNYKFKEMLSRYGAAGILIHHLNKDKEAKGINKVSGSARIVAAVWGVWQMSATDPNNDKNPTRWLKVKPREGEATTLTLDINPKDLWASQGIFSFIGEFGNESGEKRTQGERVMELLQKFSPRGLEYQEIDRYLNVGESLYTVLDRLEDRQLITKRRSLTDSRRWVYCLPKHTTDKGNATQDDGLTTKDTLPPTFFSSSVELVAETTTGKEKEDSQHLFNTHSTVIQQPLDVGLEQKAQTLDKGKDTEAQQVIQHSTKDEGERGSVEQTQFDDILQNELIAANSSTITQEEPFSKTNSQDSTSQQEAFNRKYQPVEVLNSDGEWVRGYWVHKCLVVANLEGVERKYALVDELGSKYAFLGEIRLPRERKTLALHQSQKR